MDLSKRKPDAPQQPKPPRYFPGKVVSFISICCLVMILVMRLFQETIAQRAPMFDDAFLNLATLILGFIAVVTLFFWFVFRSSYPGLVRLLTLLAIPLSIVLFFAFFKVVEVNGNMIPRFGPRFAKPADAALDSVKPVSQSKGIELGATPDDFPQFLGPDRNTYLPGPVIADDWNANPPKEIWRRKIGAGWSAFSVVNGYAVTMEQRGDDEWVACYEVATGKPVWGHSIKARYEDPSSLGGIGPRSTPTIHNGRVYSLGATGVLRCLNGADGKLIWKDDLLVRYGLTQLEAEKIVMWGRAGSPLIVDNMVVVPAGGPLGKAKSLIAYDAESGKVIWEGGDRQISYSSPIVANNRDVREFRLQDARVHYNARDLPAFALAFHRNQLRSAAVALGQQDFGIRKYMRLRRAGGAIAAAGPFMRPEFLASFDVVTSDGVFVDDDDLRHATNGGDYGG
jgi:outer membrane protein assembly factor BamB